MAYVLILAMYLYYLFTSDSVDRERTRNASRKVPRTRTSGRVLRGTRAPASSRGRTSGRTQFGGRGRAEPVDEIQEEEELEQVPAEI